MDPLPLDPDGYRGTYKLVGGYLSLDLINTVSWPETEREHDWFDPPTNVTAWAVETGLIEDKTRRRLDDALSRHPDRARSDLARVREIREFLRSALAPPARGDTPSSDAVDRLNSLLADVCGQRRLDPATLQWSWGSPTTLEEVMAPVIWNAGEVLTTVSPQRLGQCPTCDWLFHDTTRNRSRRWCDMADCGSRDKALRYYHRQRQS